MEAMTAQIRAMADEISMLKNEIVQVKGAHASLHQDTVQSSGATNRTLSEHAGRIGAVEDKMASGYGSTKKKTLIEAKNVEVGAFAGKVSDTRACFLEWCEKMYDKVALFEPKMKRAMEKITKTSHYHLTEALMDKGKYTNKLY